MAFQKCQLEYFLITMYIFSILLCSRRMWTFCDSCVSMVLHFQIPDEQCYSFSTNVPHELGIFIPPENLSMRKFDPGHVKTRLHTSEPRKLCIRCFPRKTLEILTWEVQSNSKEKKNETGKLCEINIRSALYSTMQYITYSL